MVLFGRSAAVTPYPAPINTMAMIDPMMILRRRFRPCFPFPLPTPLFDMLGLQPRHSLLITYTPDHREMFPAGLDVGICGIVPKPQATAGGPRWKFLAREVQGWQANTCRAPRGSGPHGRDFSPPGGTFIRVLYRAEYSRP